MELLFVIVMAVGIGLVLRYILPARDTYGILLLPAVSGVVTAVVWAALLWVGWTFDGTWIWVASLVAGFGAALETALILPRRRKTADARKLDRLSRAAA